MLGELLPIAGIFGLGGLAKLARKRAIGVLAKRGVSDPSLLKYGTDGANRLLKVMGSGRFDPGTYAQKAFTAKGVWSTAGRSGGQTWIDRGLGRWNTELGQMAQSGGRAAQIATHRARNAFTEAAGYARHANTLDFAAKGLSAYFSAYIGMDMFMNADRLFAKNIPTPAQEILQTQQMFLPRQAYTQRQRAIQAIHQSGMTTRSALGNEAMYMHG